MDRTQSDRTGENRTGARLAIIDRMLASEEALIPSSGFLASVMESIREQAAVPPPIPFPWKRALPGLALACGAFGWTAVELVRLGLRAGSGIPSSLPHLSAALERPLEPIGWVALALTASLLSWMLSRRLAGRSGLL